MTLVHHQLRLKLPLSGPQILQEGSRTRTDSQWTKAAFPLFTKERSALQRKVKVYLEYFLPNNLSPGRSQSHQESDSS